MHYGYDDFSALIECEFGTAANQTFTYDAFGNINNQAARSAFCRAIDFDHHIQRWVVSQRPTMLMEM